MTLEAGRTIAPGVRLARLLRTGGMASLWVAAHAGRGGEVAVKFIATSLASDPAMVARFEREAMIAARIKSAHVVEVLDRGTTDDGLPFIVMELLEGEDLKARIARRRFTLEEVSDLVTQASRALTQAHALGVVHRDIKPENVFMTSVDGRPFVKLLDFGVAKQGGPGEGGDLTETGSVVGTPVYMSPEQVLSAKHVDHRADLWSLAVVAYRALTGAVPFDGHTLGELCVAIARGDFAPPSDLTAGVPPAVDAWFARALMRDPDARFDSAKAMAEELARAVRGMPVALPPLPAPARRSIAFPLVLVASAVGGGFAAYAVARHSRDPAVVATPAVSAPPAASSVASASVEPEPTAEALPSASATVVASVSAPPRSTPPKSATVLPRSKDRGF